MEINVHEGKLSKIIKEVSHWICGKIDNCTGTLFGITKDNKLEKMIKGTKGWSKTDHFKIDTHKSEVK